MTAAWQYRCWIPSLMSGVASYYLKPTTCRLHYLPFLAGIQLDLIYAMRFFQEQSPLVTLRFVLSTHALAAAPLGNLHPET